MRHHPGLSAAAALTAMLAASAGAQTAPAQPTAKLKQGFQGYWMGVDPVDGGDARRSLIQRSDGRFEMAARDSVLTLCDGTDRGYASFEDGELVGRNVLQSNTLKIVCFNNGASVVLHVRYELLGKGLMLEHASLADGTPFSTIVLHKVSVD